MKKLIKILAAGNNSKRFLLFFAFFILLAGVTCNNRLQSPGSDPNPVGVGIINIKANPNVLFGNGAKPDGTGHAQRDSQIQVTTGEFSDGSAVSFQLTGSDLATILEGCVINADTFLTNGKAFADYVNGIFIPTAVACSSSTPPTASVNLAVTITRPSGIKQSNFAAITLDCIDTIPPAAQMITSNAINDPLTAFLTLIFQTVGIPPGTTVTFSVLNSAIGSVLPFTPTVIGSEDSGFAIAEYDSVNGMGGVQVVTAQIILPDPHVVDARCTSVPQSERTITAEVTITQTATPPPPPTPTPAPPTISVTVKPNPVVGGQQALVTAQTTGVPSNTPICFDFGSPPTNSNPLSTFAFSFPPPPPPPSCSNTDSTGKALIILNAGAVATTQDIIVRACVDNNPQNTLCDLAELSTTTSVTITPAPLPTITVAVKPNIISGGPPAIVTAQTTNLPFATKICFDIPTDSTPTSLPLNPPCVFTDSTGKALTALTVGLIGAPNQSIILRAFVDTLIVNGTFDPGELNATTVVTICPMVALICP